MTFNIVIRWRIPRDGLARFILMVKRGYRDPPYHNWSHGFTVAHAGTGPDVAACNGSPVSKEWNLVPVVDPDI